MRIGNIYFMITPVLSFFFCLKHNGNVYKSNNIKLIFSKRSDKVYGKQFKKPLKKGGIMGLHYLKILCYYLNILCQLGSYGL